MIDYIFGFCARFRAIGGILAAGAAFLLASPALANASANADIAAPLRTAQAAKPSSLDNGDEKFLKLFNNWQEFEEKGMPALAAIAETAGQAGLTSSARTMAAVSIPSLIPVASIRLTSSFGMRDHPVTGRRRAHKGIDLAAPTGTPILASADGIVSTAKWLGSYGLYVSIEHGGSIQTRYGHMSRLNVAEGERVHKGDVIGFVGTTGRSTGPHLHYEVRINGEAVNPVPYLQTEHLAQSGGDNADQGGPE